MPGRDDEPIFEAEQAPPTTGEQLLMAMGLRRDPTVAAHRRTPKQIAIGIGQTLLGGFGGVLFMLGILGVAMTLLLAIAVIVSAVQRISLGIDWPVVPISLVVFGLIGAVGYLMLRATGMFRGRRRRR